MTTSLVEPQGSQARSASASRLLVTIRDPRDRRYVPVGILAQSGDAYSFGYFRTFAESDDFAPLPGLASATTRVMRSESLFPLFAERVISARRPDHMVSLDALGLPADAAPFEVLARSHGQRVGDTVEVLPLPAADLGGNFVLRFPAHGVRHLPRPSQDRISRLGAGERLLLLPDPTNPVNTDAQLVTDTDRVRLGWVPDPLLQIIDACESHTLTVERASGPEVGFHLRLLVRLEARLRADASVYDGPEWALVE